MQYYLTRYIAFNLWNHRSGYVTVTIVALTILLMINWQQELHNLRSTAGAMERVIFLNLKNTK